MHTWYNTVLGRQKSNALPSTVEGVTPVLQYSCAVYCVLCPFHDFRIRLETSFSWIIAATQYKYSSAHALCIDSAPNFQRRSSYSRWSGEYRHVSCFAIKSKLPFKKLSYDACLLSLRKPTVSLETKPLGLHQQTVSLPLLGIGFRNDTPTLLSNHGLFIGRNDQHQGKCPINRENTIGVFPMNSIAFLVKLNIRKDRE